MILLKDYHIHTYRCKHATGDVVDYAKSAISKGVQVLGISDHTPLPDNRWLDIRMNINQLADYVSAINKAKMFYPKLTILKGMECEYSNDYHNFFQEVLIDQYGFDYLIAAGHFFPCDGHWTGAHSYIHGKKELFAYADHLIKTMNSGLFAFVAHPDLFGNSYDLWDQNTIACSRTILQAAADLKIPLEINTYGFRKPKKLTSNGERFSC